MKKIINNIILASAILVTLSSCSTVKDYRGYVPDQKLVDAIREDVDTKTSVMAMLGNPTMKATFDDANWYYYNKRTERWAFLKEKVVEMNILAITFDSDDYVSEIKHYTVADNKVIDPVTKKTITHGNNENFIAELFGNVGRFGSATNSPQAGN